MKAITREQLNAYLDDSLSETETATIERALRESEALRQQLRALIQTHDRGEHSLGAIWRRRRLSCPSRDQLGSYLLQTLDDDVQEYIAFHLDVVSCPFCQANLVDLRARREEEAPKAQARRRRFFESSAGLLRGPSD